VLPHRLHEATSSARWTAARRSAVLEELHDRLRARDSRLACHSLFLGIVMKGTRERYRQGELLIRNLLGIDQSSRRVGDQRARSST
jgi:small ligand-binding sensory domain FIST